MPLSVEVRGARLPLPAVFGALISVFVWISIVIYHEGARVIGTAWMARVSRSTWSTAAARASR